jgi:hypothetical protein
MVELMLTVCVPFLRSTAYYGYKIILEATYLSYLSQRNALYTDFSKNSIM